MGHVEVEEEVGDGKDSLSVVGWGGDKVRASFGENSRVDSVTGIEFLHSFGGEVLSGLVRKLNDWPLLTLLLDFTG